MTVEDAPPPDAVPALSFLPTFAVDAERAAALGAFAFGLRSLGGGAEAAAAPTAAAAAAPTSSLRRPTTLHV